MALLAQLHLLLPSGKATKQRTLISLHGLSGLNVKKQVSKSTVPFCMCYLACDKKVSAKMHHIDFSTRQLYNRFLGVKITESNDQAVIKCYDLAHLWEYFKLVKVQDKIILDMVSKPVILRNS
jgi:hypothetical protein